MSYELGTKVRLTQSWRVYPAGQELEQGFEVDLESLVRVGLAELLPEKKPAVRDKAKAAAQAVGGLFTR
jgi:hypothetical protein